MTPVAWWCRPVPWLLVVALASPLVAAFQPPTPFRVLALDTPDDAAACLAELDGLLCDVRKGVPDDALAELLATGDFDGCIVRSTNTITEATLARAAPRLKVVGRAGAGLDNVDCDACARRGLAVVNSPGANSEAVAEHALALTLSLARCLKPAARSVEAGQWSKAAFSQGMGLRGKTIGLVGFGQVAQALAGMAQSLGLDVLVAPSLNAEARGASKRQVADRAFWLAAHGCEPAVSLQDVLERADVLSLHLPKTPDTVGLIDAEALASMKPGSLLVSTARGGIVDETALLTALEGGRTLRGAALDVFVNEGTALGQDPVLMALAARDDVVVTPHIGGSTVEAAVAVWRDVGVAVLDKLREGTGEGDKGSSSSQSMNEGGGGGEGR